MSREDDLEDSFDSSIMRAMSKYYLARQGAEFIGGSLIPRLFPSEADKNARKIARLDIIERKRRLGLPHDTDDYEDLLDSDSALLNPGRGLTLGASLARNQAPLRLGASALSRSFPNGAIGRGIGLIGKLFR